jgi:transcription termination/antitermination protein NusA
MKNALKPATVREIRVTERTDGKKMAVITVNPKDKGVAIGKNGKNAERLRFLGKTIFRHSKRKHHLSLSPRITAD